MRIVVLGTYLDRENNWSTSYTTDLELDLQKTCIYPSVYILLWSVLVITSLQLISFSPVVRPLVHPGISDVAFQKMLAFLPLEIKCNTHTVSYLNASQHLSPKLLRSRIQT